jgi:hypothetical protein
MLRKTYCLHHQGDGNEDIAAVSSSETSFKTYLTTRCYVPEDSRVLPADSLVDDMTTLYYQVETWDRNDISGISPTLNSKDSARLTE